MTRIRTRRFLIGTLLLVTALGSACTVRTADLTMVTNRLVELDGIDLDELPARRVEGVDTKFMFILLPLPAFQPSIEAAVDQALDKGQGDLLTDAVVSISNYFAVIGSVQTIRVKGDVVDTRQRVRKETKP